MTSFFAQLYQAPRLQGTAGDYSSTVETDRLVYRMSECRSRTRTGKQELEKEMLIKKNPV